MIPNARDWVRLRCALVLFRANPAYLLGSESIVCALRGGEARFSAHYYTPHKQLFKALEYWRKVRHFGECRDDGKIINTRFLTQCLDLISNQNCRSG